MKPLLGLIIFATQAVAAHNPVALHISCEAPSPTCQEYRLPSSETLLLESPAKLLLDPSNVTQVEELAQASLMDSGRLQLNLTLNEETAAKFSELSRQNKGKRLGILNKDKLLMSPMIQAEITSNSIVLGSPDDDGTLFQHFPWLQEMAQGSAETHKKRNDWALLAYSLLGGFALGGSIYYVFLRKGRKENDL